MHELFGVELIGEQFPVSFFQSGREATMKNAKKLTNLTVPRYSNKISSSDHIADLGLASKPILVLSSRS